MKSYAKAMLILVVTLVISSAATAASVWEISKDGNTLIIGGTVHLLKPSDFPLPAAYDRAFERADKLYLEADMAAASSMEFGMRVMQVMMLTDGTTLKDHLEEETWQLLQAFTAERQIPVSMLTPFRPSLAAITLTVMEMQRLGMGDGVDMHFYQRAQEKNMPMGYLETLDEVLDFMKLLNDLDGDAMMLSTLRELETVDAQMASAVAAWREGDMKKLYALMGEDMRKEFPDMYDALLTQRNKSWFKHMTGLLETPEVEFVLVGALHTAGPSSLLKMFADAGYTVKPLAAE